MKRGIRQGCPLSPLLFALYANPIAIAMERVNRMKGKEPAMLMYADDMVVWRGAEEEVQEKLQVAKSMMETLGLQMSMEKTELQHNQWVSPSKEGQEMTIITKKGPSKIKYQEVLRYLVWGLILLHLQILVISALAQGEGQQSNEALPTMSLL